MGSSTKPHQRVFALVGALLFLATTVAVTAVVIIQANQENSANKTSTSDQTSSSACAIGSEQNVETLPNPEAFKPQGDVKTLETKDLETGSGTVIQKGDCLIVKYYGTLATTGEKFDGDFDKPEGLKFQYGVGQVIPGWDTGLDGMRVGGTRRLVIPSELGYGAQGGGTIPPNADLVFVVKILKILK
jgi:FKBP-type peptidyl-prolyl cis-trans isomerase